MDTSTFTTSAADVADLGALLGVWAHPDDETYLSGGLVAAAIDNGQRVTVVTATFGEAGFDDPVRWPPERAAWIRRCEASAAMAVLGVTDHRWLGYPDGRCDRVEVAVAAESLAGLIDDVRPDTILTFGADGITGHADHRAVHRWVAAATGCAGTKARVLHATVDDRTHARLTHLDRRVDLYADPSLPLTTPREALAVHLELRGLALDRKVAALRAQATQTAPVLLSFGDDDYREWVATESFVAARTD